MLCTGSYKNFENLSCNTYAISGNCGRDVNYEGKCYPILAPKLSFWKIWHNNIGIIPEKENNKFYIQEYYKQVLSKLDPEEIYRELDGSILLCYEDNTKFCHRHIASAWLELLLDVKVPEVKLGCYNLEVIERPNYIKNQLEEIMKNEKNMRGFNSLRELYLFEKKEKLEYQSNFLEEQDEIKIKQKRKLKEQ